MFVGEDIEGQRFNGLVAIHREGGGRWLFKCDCGNEKSILKCHVKDGFTKSCGCLRKKHGQTRSLAYASWRNTKERCFNSKHPWFGNYGGRGVYMCDKWKDSFKDFLADMGERPAGTSLDRINSEKGYEPGNCKWSTRSEQSANQRRYKKEKVA